MRASRTPMPRPLPGRVRFLVSLLAGVAGLGGPGSQAAPAPEGGWQPRALVLESVGRAGRNTLFTDAVEAELVAGRWRRPGEGDAVTAADGRSRSWAWVQADTNGWFTGRPMRGGWAHFAVESPDTRVRILNVVGSSMTYVNGAPRAGDLYQYGTVQVPVLLGPGTNDVLVPTGRGRLRVRWYDPPADAYLNPGDMTAPDLLVGEKTDVQAAVVVVNATADWARDLELIAGGGDGYGREVRTPVPDLPPLGVRKTAFTVRGPAPGAEGPARVRLRLVRRGQRDPRDEAVLEWRIRRPDQVHKRTFVSGIDGSVQYYAVQPATGPREGASPALFLSLHGASVEALGQAESYAPKRWGTLVAPTNRRPYGFDWEEWGRMDALEVLDLATARFRPDPSRVYLTGHSMGGHGTWSVGVTYPDRFAAVAPSAGWISFFSYAGTDPFTNATPVEGILRRAAASSDTLAMVTNLLHLGVYVVHGDADDNVPIREARRMREVLSGFHRDVDGHEQPGAGHWWGSSDEPGAECVDWPPMFDFFARHRRPSSDEVRRIRFTTVNPGVSSRSHWLGIEGQEHPLEPSDADALWDPGLRRVTVSTRNVRRLVLEADGFLAWSADARRRGAERPATVTVSVDGTVFDGVVPGGADAGAGWVRPVALERSGGVWVLAGPQAPTRKGPHRHGPFKDAFRHGMVLVYGTRGTDEENAWALAKARFDSESFWYRGNASLEVMPDTAFRAERLRDRGVILYGHADMNGAWASLLASSPVQVRRGRVVVGGRTVERDDAAALFLQPRPDSDRACVAVVAGTGMPGLRLTNRLPYFMAGTGYPDCLVLGSGVLAKGTGGIVAAGFFGPDWSVESGEFAWGE